MPGLRKLKVTVLGLFFLVDWRVKIGPSPFMETPLCLELNVVHLIFSPSCKGFSCRLLDIEKYLSGNELQIGGFDLLYKESSGLGFRVCRVFRV